MRYGEPLLPTQTEEIADLAKMVSTPIALGERLYSRFDFRPYLERRAIDIAQPDVGDHPLNPLLDAERASPGRSLWWYQRAP